MESRDSVVYIDFSECRDLYRIDGEPMEFECKNFQGYTTLKLFDEVHHMMEMEVGIFIAQIMMFHFRESERPVFLASSASS